MKISDFPRVFSPLKSAISDNNRGISPRTINRQMAGAGGGSGSRKNPRSRTAKLSAVDDELHRVPRPDRARRVRDRTRTYGPLKILDVDFRLVIAAGVVACVVLFYAISRLVAVESVDQRGRLPRVITPFPAPKIMDLPQVSLTVRLTLFWCAKWKFGVVFFFFL